MKKIDPDELDAVADWLDTMIKDCAGMLFSIYPNGRQREVTKSRMVGIIHSAAKRLREVRDGE